jgi:hypothetical protein
VISAVCEGPTEAQHCRTSRGGGCGRRARPACPPPSQVPFKHLCHVLDGNTNRVWFFRFSRRRIWRWLSSRLVALTTQAVSSSKTAVKSNYTAQHPRRQPSSWIPWFLFRDSFPQISIKRYSLSGFEPMFFWLVTSPLTVCFPVLTDDHVRSTDLGQ